MGWTPSALMFAAVQSSYEFTMQSSPEKNKTPQIKPANTGVFDILSCSNTTFQHKSNTAIVGKKQDKGEDKCQDLIKLHPEYQTVQSCS